MTKRCLLIIISYIFCSAANAAHTPEQIWSYIKSVGGVDNALKDIASKGAKNLPQKIDSETEVFSVSTLHNEIHFNSRLINYEKSEISDIKKLKRIVHKQNINYLCSSPVAKVLIKEANVKYTYSYYSKTYEFVFDYTVGKSQCNQL